MLQKYQRLWPVEQHLFDALAMCLLFFYAYSAVIAPAATQYHRGIFVIVTYVMIFLVYGLANATDWAQGWKKIFLKVVDYCLIGLSIYSLGYWVMNFEAINYRVGAETLQDQYTAVIGVLLGLEIARRVIGWFFIVLGGVILLYGVYGDATWIPEDMQHAGDSFIGLCTSIFYKSDGVFGIMTNVLATYILMFILFGAFLERCGAQQFFVNLSMAAVGHRVGGPAKVAVIASGLMGSISGSAVANTVSTGAFTIPLMKKAGFKPHVAGGIEPAASIGGMFMPPIMGAGGFLMAEMTGLPYSQIMLVAVFPALMYFFSVYLMVHFEAKKQNITGEKSENSAFELFKSQWYYLLPLLIISALMLYGFSPGYAAILGIATCIIVSYFKKDTAIKFNGFVESTRAGVLNSLQIGATLGVIGIIVGVFTYSGLVLTFADIVIEWADGSLWLTIIFVALASLILGMGVPVTASYLIVAVVAVPALTHLGVNLIAAHMIVYWLSQDSNITPPVCIAAFAGATIAKANLWKTALTAFKFAKFLYLAPFLFGYVPGFSLNGSAQDIAVAMFLIVVGTYLYSWLLSGVWLSEKKAVNEDQ